MNKFCSIFLLNHNNHHSTGVSAGVSAVKKFKLEFQIRYTETDFKSEQYDY